MKRFAAIGFSVMLAGCGSGLDKVKSGVLEFNKTITVGQALDNWKSCASREWKEFKTDNGVQVVEFTCNQNIAAYAEQLRAGNPSAPNLKLLYLDIASNKTIFQFTLNKDDTFQVDNVQIVTNWADGTSFTAPAGDDMLKNAYDNKVIFDPAEAKGLNAQIIAAVFEQFKPAPKTQVITAPAVVEKAPPAQPAAIPPAVQVAKPQLDLGPSFDCSKAASYAEKSVCSDTHLGRLDGALAKNYQAMQGANIGEGALADLKKTQRAWNAEKNKCADMQCLLRAYTARIEDVCEYPVVSGVHPACISPDDV